MKAAAAISDWVIDKPFRSTASMMKKITICWVEELDKRALLALLAIVLPSAGLPHREADNGDYCQPFVATWMDHFEELALSGLMNRPPTGGGEQHNATGGGMTLATVSSVWVLLGMMPDTMSELPWTIRFPHLRPTTRENKSINQCPAVSADH